MRTREKLRADLLSGVDRVRDSWVLKRLLSKEERNLCIAGRQCLSKDNPSTNNYLDDMNLTLATLEHEMDHEMQWPWPWVRQKPTFAEVLLTFTLFTSTTWKWFWSLFGF